MSVATDCRRIKVALMAMMPREKRLMEFFFTHRAQDIIELCPFENADIGIFDLDSAGAMEAWKTFSSKNGQQKTVVLSVLKQELSGTHWVAKPVNPVAILDAIKIVYGENSIALKATQEMVNSSSLHKKSLDKAVLSEKTTASAVHPVRRIGLGAAVLPTVAVRPLPKTKKRQVPIKEIEPAPEHARLITGLARNLHESDYCGIYDDVDFHNKAQIPAIFYCSKHRLVNVLKTVPESIGKQQAVVQIILANKQSIILFPSLNEAYTSLCPDTLLKTCQESQEQAKVKQTLLDSEKVIEAKKRCANGHTLLQFDSFLWEVALLCARGRLVEGTNINRYVSLKHWPNMTRVRTFPHVMRIAALWASEPTCLKETSRILGICQRHVFSFFNAAEALDLIELVEPPVDSEHKDKRDELEYKVAEPEQKAVSKKKHKKRGLFSKILGHLGLGNQ